MKVHPLLAAAIVALALGATAQASADVRTIALAVPQSIRTHAPNAAIAREMTVRSVASGMVTMTTPSGEVMTINVSASDADALGLHAGSLVAVTVTTNGVMLTNLDALQPLMGPGVVRSLRAGTISYVNGTGFHTLVVPRGILARLRLRAGSAISVDLDDQARLVVSASQSP